MYKNLFHYTFFFFSFTVVTACSSLSAITQPTQIADITSTNSATNNPSPVSIITIPAVTEAQVTPTSISIIPDIKIIAPDAREVKLSDLGLNASTRLILYYEPSDSLRIMSGQDANPQKIPINSKSINSHGIVISPNQKWFAYDTFKEKRDGVAYNDIWITEF